MNYPKGKLYFKNPKRSECIGFQGAGTCMECLQRDSSKVSCKKLTEYLNKRDWNRIMKESPLYTKDYKARESMYAPDMKGKEILVDQFGVPLKPRRVA